MKPIRVKIERTLYSETAIMRVLQVLFKHPDKEFSLSDLAQEAGVAKANIGAMLRKLHKAQLIEITQLTKIWRIKANRTNWNFIKAKITYNIGLIYQSGIIEYLITKVPHVKAVVLFGSYRKGEDITSSDIDIALESDEEKSVRSIPLHDALKGEDKKRVEEFERLFERKIQVHLFNRKAIDLNVFNTIANGIVLWGFLEVKK